MQRPGRTAAALVAAIFLALALPVAIGVTPAAAQKKTKKKPCSGNRTEGYSGVCKAPKFNPPAPRPSVPLGVNGRNPETVVDNAGTAHIVWNQDGGDTGPDVLRYCRLRRGSKACDNPPNTQALVPVQNDQGNEPQFNEDLGGPRVVVVGDDLTFISHRYPNVTSKPDGSQPSSRSTYLWVSDNGGNSVTGGRMVGTAEPSGGATVFTGPTGAPQIGLISDTRTNGSFFQAISPGNFTTAEAALGTGDQAYSGSLITVAGKPMTAFADLGGNTFIRRWSGAGSPADPNTWNVTRTTGTDPILAAGPLGAFLATTPAARNSIQVRRLADTTPGKAANVATGPFGARDMIVDPGGALRLAWVDSTGKAPQIIQRTTTDGARFGTKAILAQGQQAIDQIDLGSTFDGGGFAAYVGGATSQGYGTIFAAPFGTQAKNNLAGLGNLPGGGADPNVTTACERISFRAVEMLTSGETGCFSSAIGEKGVKITEGTLKFNGLEIIPDPGTQIRIDTKGKKAIDTVTASGKPGKVTVQLRAGSSPIVLYRGALHLEIPSGAAGTKLATFDPAGLDLKGFPITGKFDVILKQNSVEIPMEIGLPKSLLSITAGVTLKANNARGLFVDSLRFRLPKVAIGPLDLAGLDVSWTGSTDTWKGTAELKLFKVGIRVAVQFDRGRFTDGQVTVTPVAFPGIALGSTNVYINNIFGRLQLLDNSSFVEGGVLFGVQPVSPPSTYVVNIRGAVRVNWRPAFLFTVSGDASLGGTIPLASARATADLDGNFTASGQAQFKVPLVRGSGKFDAFVAAGTGKFGANLDAKVTVGESPITVDVGVKAGFSDKEIFGCQSPIGGFRYTFAERDFTPYVFRCPGEPEIPQFVLNQLKQDPAALAKFYRDKGIPQPVANGPQAAQAATTPGFTVPPGGFSGVSVTAIGVDRAPGFTLVSPGGQTIVPQPANAAARGSKAVFTKTFFRTIVGVDKPQAGFWRIVESQPGSIGVVNMARELPKPTVKIKVSGKGRKRTLRYTATARRGLVIRLFERMGKAGHQIGTITKKRGTIRFRAADGRGGRRVIEAHAEQNGLPVQQANVGSFRAPAPARPARVRGVKAGRKGRTVTVRWRRAAGATSYLVRASFKGGRVVKLVSGRSLRIRRVDPKARVRITVVGRNAKGRTGKAGRGTTKATAKKRKSRAKKR